jgi:streptogramin lyase
VRNFGAFPEIDEPFDIKDGSDGWLWFTNKSGNSLGRIHCRSADGSSSQS